MVGLVVALAFLYATAALAATAYSLRELPGRLGRLLHYAKEASSEEQAVTVADIGCDHGLLSLALCESIKHSHIYATDQSAGSKEKVNALVAASAVDCIEARRRITVLTGDGLEPLLQHGCKADVLVLAGMGVRSIVNILSRNTATDVGIGEGVVDFSSLDTLGVREIIVQPWPEHYLLQHHLYKLMLSHGYCYSDQSVDTTSRGQKKSFYYITTRFTKRVGSACSNSAMGGAAPDDLSTQRQSPLYTKLVRGLLQPREREAYLSYLRKQRRTVASRRAGLAGGGEWLAALDGLIEEQLLTGGDF